MMCIIAYPGRYGLTTMEWIAPAGWTVEQVSDAFRRQHQVQPLHITIIP
jgi:hypothetical protein